MPLACVTGFDAVTPAGPDAGHLWDAVRHSRSFGAPVSFFDASRNQSRIAADVPGWSPETSGLTSDEHQRHERHVQFALAAGRRAARMAQLNSGSQLDRRRAGVVIGTAIGGVSYMERRFAQMCLPDGDKPSQVKINPSPDRNLYRAFLASTASACVAADHDFHGACLTITTGCTAGLDAIGTAIDLVELGVLDVVLTGGTEAPITPIVLTAFDNIRALTRRNSEPAMASRPFDRDRDGFLLAEGCAMLVVESARHARARGVPLLAELRGFASSSNAYHMTGLPADGEELARTIRLALGRSRVEPARVDYINAHGSSTQQNDRNEVSAFKNVFGSDLRHIPVSSTKSIIGHALGAASAIETVLCIQAIQNDLIPPTVNYRNPDPSCDIDVVPNVPRSGRIDVAECNASGFSGVHSSLILARPNRLEAMT